MTNPFGAGGGYRADIDGLRALAVLSVVVYHLHKPWLPGGYVGVDIFFVISGFLITRNIWGEMAEGRFSLAAFYLRRIRRIVPAFLVMTSLTLVAGALLLMPEDLAGLGRSTLWAALSLSNIYFWRFLDTGYFAESSEEQPLLHTWSLGVEEQFYFLWPALLMMAMLLPRRRAAALGIAGLVCLVSFAIGEWAQAASPQFAFYMLPARAGELMLGALLALAGGRAAGDGGSLPAPAWSEMMALAGFGLIGYALIGLDDGSAFPGINALYPCVGTVLVMIAGARGARVVRWLLTPRPVVFIGLVSYSLYLWHWPILAYLRYFNGSIGLATGAAAVLAMSVLAVLSYYFVERPARRWQAPARRQLLRLYVLPTLGLCLAAGAIVGSGGLKSTIESSGAVREGLAQVRDYTAPAYEFEYNCQLEVFDPDILQAPRCLVGATAQADPPKARVLVWGDSQAAHYLGVIGSVAEADGIVVRNATFSACPPLFGGDYSFPPYKAGCDQFRPMIESELMSRRFRTVVLGGAWNVYQAVPGFREDFERTVRQLTARGVRVVVIGQVPQFRGYNRQCELRGVRVGGLRCDERVADPGGDTGINHYLAEFARSTPRVTYLDVRDVVCSEHGCRPHLDGKPLYFDASHLSMSGSWRIGAKVVEGPSRKRWSRALRGG